MQRNSGYIHQEYFEQHREDALLRAQFDPRALETARTPHTTPLQEPARRFTGGCSSL